MLTDLELQFEDLEIGKMKKSAHFCIFCCRQRWISHSLGKTFKECTKKNFLSF